MSENKKGGSGCLIFGVFLIICLIGFLMAVFHSDEAVNKNKKIKTYLTLEDGNQTDTLAVLISPYSISKDYGLKRKVNESTGIKDSLMTYAIDVPNGLTNTILIARNPTDKSLDLDSAVTGSINTLKNNSEVKDLSYSVKDTVIQTAKAKIVNGKFYAQNKNALLKEVTIDFRNCLYSFQFVDEENNIEWAKINQLIKNIELVKKSN